MTISEERIQAEVEAEIRRIAAWDQANRSYPQYLFPLMEPAQVRSLAEHLVRNRLQVEMGQQGALLEAALDLDSLFALYVEDLSGNGVMEADKPLLNKARAAIKLAKEGAA